MQTFCVQRVSALANLYWIYFSKVKPVLSWICLNCVSIYRKYICGVSRVQNQVSTRDDIIHRPHEGLVRLGGCKYSRYPFVRGLPQNQVVPSAVAVYGRAFRHQSKTRSDYDSQKTLLGIWLPVAIQHTSQLVRPFSLNSRGVLTGLARNPIRLSSCCFDRIYYCFESVPVQLAVGCHIKRAYLSFFLSDISLMAAFIAILLPKLGQLYFYLVRIANCFRQ